METRISEQLQENNPENFELEDIFGCYRIKEYVGPRCPSIVIPERINGKIVNQIGYGVFQGYRELTNINIPDLTLRIDNCAFMDCCNLVEVNGLERTMRIGESAFRGCSKLVGDIALKIASEIGPYAFCDCHSLTSITISENLKLIDDGVFSGCINLKSIIIPKSFLKIRDNAFEGCKSITIYAPAGSYVEEYARNNSIPFHAI